MIARVGRTGNARSTAPHVHFQMNLCGETSSAEPLHRRPAPVPADVGPGPGGRRRRRRGLVRARHRRLRPAQRVGVAADGVPLRHPRRRPGAGRRRLGRRRPRLGGPVLREPTACSRFATTRARRCRRCRSASRAGPTCGRSPATSTATGATRSACTARVRRRSPCSSTWASSPRRSRSARPAAPTPCRSSATGTATAATASASSSRPTVPSPASTTRACALTAPPRSPPAGAARVPRGGRLGRRRPRGRRHPAPRHRQLRAARAQPARSRRGALVPVEGGSARGAGGRRLERATTSSPSTSCGTSSVPLADEPRSSRACPALNAAMLRAGISTPARKAAFLATLRSESAFRYDAVEAGNDSQYRGRGFIQITGEANYRSAGDFLGLDLLENPDLAINGLASPAIAAWYWTVARNINVSADELDMAAVNIAIGFAPSLRRDMVRCSDFLAALRYYSGGQVPPGVNCAAHLCLAGAGVLGDPPDAVRLRRCRPDGHGVAAADVHPRGVGPHHDPVRGALRSPDRAADGGAGSATTRPTGPRRGPRARRRPPRVRPRRRRPRRRPRRTRRRPRPPRPRRRRRPRPRRRRTPRRRRRPRPRPPPKPRPPRRPWSPTPRRRPR